ncbi:MAG: hypothetical protein AAF787_04975 [Chloroflexota bacterium]
MNITVVLFAILGMYISGNWLISSISKLARSFRISQLVAGLTIVTLVTSVPELTIAINAAAEGASGITLGTVAGSNIVNLSLIIGISGLLAGGMRIATGLVRRGIPVMIGIAVVVYVLLWVDQFSRPMGVVMLIVFLSLNIAGVYFLRRDAAIRQLTTTEMKTLAPFRTQDLLLIDDNALLPGEMVNRPWQITRMVLAVLLLLVCANALVQNALIFRDQLGANEVAVGSTVIALAASLPEMVAVIVAVNRKQSEVALGNIVGSSIANLLLVLGIATTITPVVVDPRARLYEFPVMLVLMLLLIPVALDNRLRVWEAAGGLLAYAAFFAGVFVLF